MLALRFPAEGEYSQEDAASFCQFLLNQIGVASFRIRTRSLHGLDHEPAALSRGVERENHIAVSCAVARDGTTLHDLLTSNIVHEECEPQKALVATFQSIELDEADFPQAFPVVLKRYRFDRMTNEVTKNRTKIFPSSTIDLALIGNDYKKARYKLTAAILHSGNSPRGGHYYTCAPTAQPGQFVQFNDARVTLQQAESAIEDIAQNGYIHFYEFDRFISA
jgi:uncharacterized UBP type Zn finger protein